MSRRAFIVSIMIVFCASRCFASAAPLDTGQSAARAAEVTRYIQQNMYNRSSGLYFHSVHKHDPEFMWGNGVMLSALVGACRYQPDVYLPILSKFFKAMDRYWDAKAPIPGYEPTPTAGNGNDKYYDDNEWMVLTFVEAFEVTNDPRYLKKAEAALSFSLSGWDDQLGGGILWHEPKKDQSKNTCSNAPAALGCLQVAKLTSAEQAKTKTAMAIKIVEWTNQHFQSPDGLYEDSESVSTQVKNTAKLTYNTALMIRSDLGLYRSTGEAKYLQQAKQSSQAADWFLDKKTGAYRDAVKWSHLQVEADLEMYRVTHEDYLIARARKNAEHFYLAWKAKPSNEVIDNASIARMLWLLSDTESTVGQQFWARADKGLPQ